MPGPKKRHGNRKPVVPAYHPTNLVPIFNAAYILAGAVDTDDWEAAQQNLRDKIAKAQRQTDRMVEIINILDHMID
jgi:hypothetical protein